MELVIFGFKILRKRRGHHYVPNIYGKSSHKMVDPRENKLFFHAARKVVESKRTTLFYDRLFYIYQSFVNVINNTPKKKKINILEVGVYKGGSSYFFADLASSLTERGRVKIYSVDTFTGHSGKDLPTGIEGAHVPERFSETSYENVKKYLSKFSFVKVIEGRIQDCTKPLESRKFNLVYLDVDIYEPTYFSLVHFKKHLAKYAIILVDDYNFKTCPGVKKAVNQFLSENQKTFTKLELETGQCMLLFQKP